MFTARLPTETYNFVSERLIVPDFIDSLFGPSLLSPTGFSDEPFADGGKMPRLLFSVHGTVHRVIPLHWDDVCAAKQMSVSEAVKVECLASKDALFMRRPFSVLIFDHKTFRGSASVAVPQDGCQNRTILQNRVRLLDSDGPSLV